MQLYGLGIFQSRRRRSIWRASGDADADADAQLVFIGRWVGGATFENDGWLFVSSFVLVWAFSSREGRPMPSHSDSFGVAWRGRNKVHLISSALVIRVRYELFSRLPSPVSLLPVSILTLCTAAEIKRQQPTARFYPHALHAPLERKFVINQIVTKLYNQHPIEYPQATQYSAFSR